METLSITPLQHQNKLLYCCQALAEATLYAETKGAETTTNGRYLCHALAMTCIDSNFDNALLESTIASCLELRKKIEESYPDYLSQSKFPTHDDPAWEDNALFEFIIKDNDSEWFELKRFLLFATKGLASYCEQISAFASVDSNIYHNLMQVIVNLNNIESHDDIWNIIEQVAADGFQIMTQLDGVKTNAFGIPEVTLVATVNGEKPGILVCGEDMEALYQLLEQSREQEVDIYTHDSLLGAHSYPAFKKERHLVANYGFEIGDHVNDFEKFGGAILLTTSPLPYIDADSPLSNRVFTTGSVSLNSWNAIERNDKDSSRDFSQLIAKAKTMTAPAENNGKELTIGFRHQQTMNLLPRMAQSIKNGTISKLLLVAGCDNGQDEYGFYKQLIEAQKEDCLILTAGNIKYQFNQDNLGTLANMPRILDAGQCADIYSWHIIFNELVKEAELKEVTDLPIEFHLAWFSEKSILIYITMLKLGYQQIYLGPTTPPFITNAMQEELAKRYHCKFINVVESH